MEATSSRNSWGPLNEYNERVEGGQLRDDKHQRSIVQGLQDLHDMLCDYHPPTVNRCSAKPRRRSWFSALFTGGDPRSTQLCSNNSATSALSRRQAPSSPANTPKGLYMYGDVGSGKTMLMDLFFNTLPPHIQQKRRIHFHNFMQEVHHALHVYKLTHDDDGDAMSSVASEIARTASVLCFDEFQCTDVADAMILRGLIERLIQHGVVLVTTSNRHPDELYRNGIQRQSFIPCINLLKTGLRVINLDSSTDYRKIPRPPSGVYHHPLDKAAKSHALKWFEFLGDFDNDPPHVATLQVWGREVQVPACSGDAAMFTFDQLLGRATGAADYIELTRVYHGLVITDVPGMNHRSRDLARRFITFIDAVYESQAKLVLTTAVPLHQLFMSADEIDQTIENTTTSDSDAEASIKPRTAGVASKKGTAEEVVAKATAAHGDGHVAVDDVMRQMMDDLGISMNMMKSSGLFSGDEERFAFSRALSRLREMGSQDWVERGLGLENRGGLGEKERWQRVRSKYREDSM